MRTPASATNHDKCYTDFHSSRSHESPASSDKENEHDARPTRHRQASEREAQRLQDEEEKAERKARKAAKKVEQARKKQLAAAASTAASIAVTQRPGPPSSAANEGNNSDSNDDDDGEKYTSHTVQARPQMIKALAKRNQRVPQPAVEGSDTEDQPLRGRHSKALSQIGRIRRIETPEQESPPPHRATPHRARSFTRPSSPDAGDKRSRSIEDDFRSAKEPKRQSGVRPKQADYSPTVQEVISTAIQLWRIKIFCENAFPTIQQEATWVTEVWQAACTPCTD